VRNNEAQARPLVNPTVNLTGSTAQSLVDDIIKVINSLRDAEKAMAWATPHGRDYKDFDDWRLARDAWHDRRNAVAAMMSELEEYAYAIAMQDTRKINTKESNL
jgi:hypothetical protein